MKALVDSMAFPLMLARLCTLNEGNDDEAEAVNDILQCFLNMLEIDPSMADRVAGTAVTEADRPPLLKWLWKRLHPREFKQFDANKGSATELLAILAQVRLPERRWIR